MANGASRTDVILAAVAHQLRQRRELLDGAEDLGEVVITVRLNAGTSQIRTIEVSEQHVNRRAYDRAAQAVTR